MSEIKFGIGKVAMRSHDAVVNICSIVEESLIPEAEAMGDEKLLAAAKALSDISCGLGFAGNIDDDLLRIHVQKMVSNQPVDPPDIAGLTRVCGIVENELMPHARSLPSEGVDIGEVKRASRSVKVGASTAGPEFGTEKIVSARFIDKGLECAAGAISKLSCDAVAYPNTKPDVRDEAACLNQFADRIRSLDRLGKGFR